MASPVIWPGVMTRLMALPADLRRRGGDRLVSREVRQQARPRPTVCIAAQAMTTDTPDTSTRDDMMRGGRLRHGAAPRRRRSTRRPASARRTSTSSSCTTASPHNELITYEALGLCPEGGAEKFIDDGDNTYGGRFVTNPSGGLLSKGHPLGATGLAQCAELMWQLRGTAEAAPGRGRAARAAAQPRPRRRLRRHAVRTRLRTRHGRSIRRRAHASAGHRARRARAPAVLRQGDRRTNPVYTTPQPRARPASRDCRCRRPISSVWK